MKQVLTLILVSVVCYCASAASLYAASDPTLQELFEGDILRSNVRNSGINRNAVVDSSQLWAKGEIPYIMEGQFPADGMAALEAAMQDIQKNTCIRFRKKTNADQYFIAFQSDVPGCYSYVGRTEAKKLVGQPIGLNYLCWSKGVIGHELMHAIGFWHEHSRWDRDEFIVIDYSNVQDGKQSQFDKRPKESADNVTQYDYDSLLHYGEHAYARDYSRPTIIPKRKEAQIGQRDHFSQLDYAKIKKLYSCDQGGQPTTTTTTTTTKPTPAPTGGTKCSAASQNCVDSDPQCASFAQMGWCEKMPGRMLFLCPKACCNCDSNACTSMALTKWCTACYSISADLEKKCFDSNDEYYQMNYCDHYFSVNEKRYLYPPENCWNDESKDLVRRFCPKTCGLCKP